MVPKEGDPVREALKRLGAPMKTCSQCDIVFNWKRLPRHYVKDPVADRLAGEDAISNPPTDFFLYCSQQCAEAVVEEQRKVHIEKGSEPLLVYEPQTNPSLWEEEGWTPPPEREPERW